MKLAMTVSGKVGANMIWRLIKSRYPVKPADNNKG